ncbi:MAG TPA: hypothetical protein VFA10_17995 [Ktedonobacteraceae bacterium]|nr:hypothetical protein [Ktedonobacteraceae bacterium]
MSNHADFYEGLFKRLYQADKRIVDAQQPPNEAICFECQVTRPVDAVYSGYEQGDIAPCGHSWNCYRYNGQYVLE